MSSGRAVSTRPIAQRTCVSCREIKDKRELVRLVRTAEGNIEIDTSGKREGRGAYLCSKRECWEAALKGNRLEHALKSRLTPENRQQIAEGSQALFKGDNQW